jgi:hypothetical protein
MRENRQYGSEGGESHLNATPLPPILSVDTRVLTNAAT